MKSIVNKVVFCLVFVFGSCIGSPGAGSATIKIAGKDYTVDALYQGIVGDKASIALLNKIRQHDFHEIVRMLLYKAMLYHDYKLLDDIYRELLAQGWRPNGALANVNN